VFFRQQEIGGFLIFNIKAMAKQMICTLCGYAGAPNKKTKGNFLIEVILWLFFLIPGLIYSIWRLSSKQDVCAKCGNTNVIPQDSPQAQKMMAEQRNNPSISKDSLEPEKTSTKTRNIMLGVVAGVFILVIIAISTSIDDAKERKNQESSIQPALQGNAVQQNLPTEPKARIETIVKNLGANYEITLFGKNPNVKAIAPFEVIINTDAGSCAFAKQMNFDVMKALYSDSITAKNIARIRFNARKYLSTSLGGDDAREMPAQGWQESGPTNFLKVLTQMGSGDLGSKKMERQTWGKELESCN